MLALSLSPHVFASKSAVNVAVLVWGIAAACAWLWMSCYGFKTYAASETFAAQTWPRDSDLELALDRPTLLLFVHPRCPCTRASVRELERLLTDAESTSCRRPRVVAVATLPADASVEWREATVVGEIERLANAVVRWDIDGVEATRFGAVTSGTVMLYRPEGTRVFAGGITASRGHEGPNVGLDRLATALRHKSLQESTPVFGCRLCVEDGAAATACSSNSRRCEEALKCDGETR
jgi:hypothetical protein